MKFPNEEHNEWDISAIVIAILLMMSAGSMAYSIIKDIF